MKVLTIVAHADDEVLGCGGTMALHSKNGDEVYVAILADGVSSRNNIVISENSYDERNSAAERSCEVLGINKPILLSLPDNQLDSLPLLNIIQKVEDIIKKVQPDIIYTHNSSDLNIDHRVTYQAVMTACRPLPNNSVKKILSFEVNSSTEWSNDGLGVRFTPNYFVDISSTIDIKIEALKCYEVEMRDFPHARSTESVEALSVVRGSSVGVSAAEAFVVQRIIL